jgi:hypothetical protein
MILPRQRWNFLFNPRPFHNEQRINKIFRPKLRFPYKLSDLLVLPKPSWSMYHSLSSYFDKARFTAKASEWTSVFSLSAHAQSPALFIVFVVLSPMENSSTSPLLSSSAEI